MRVLVAGGLCSPTAGYDNAVFSLAKGLSAGNRVCAVALTSFPVPPTRPPPVPFEIRSRYPSPLLLGRCVLHGNRARHAIGEYVKHHSMVRALSMIRYSINLSEIQSAFEDFRPDVVHVHSIDLERLAFLEFMLEQTDVPLLVTIHGLYSLDPTIVNQYDADRLERNLFRRLERRRAKLVFVSSGLAEAATRRFGLDEK